jgi:HK97 family phage prohead protease
MTTTAASPTSTGSREIRTFRTRLTARDVGGPAFTVSGYASLVSTPYDMGSYEEQISPGAFGGCLRNRPDVQLLVNHEGPPLARTTVPPGQPGHLALTEDHKGLRFDAQLDRDDPDARLVHRKVASGLMDQCSFAFRVTDQSWNADRSVRTISEVNLDRCDVSIVNYGASPTTSVDARAVGRRTKGSNLSLYQARARASALRSRQIFIMNEAGRRR